MGSCYKDLIIWQKAMEVAKNVYVLVKKLPKDETYALSDQMRRAAVSIPSNIAEGQGRAYNRSFSQFLSIARGSALELETQLQLCVMIQYLSQEDIQPTMDLLEEIERMIHSIKRKL